MTSLDRKQAFWTLADELPWLALALAENRVRRVVESTWHWVDRLGTTDLSNSWLWVDTLGVDDLEGNYWDAVESNTSVPVSAERLGILAVAVAGLVLAHQKSWITERACLDLALGALATVDAGSFPPYLRLWVAAVQRHGRSEVHLDHFQRMLAPFAARRDELPLDGPPSWLVSSDATAPGIGKERPSPQDQQQPEQGLRRQQLISPTAPLIAKFRDSNGREIVFHWGQIKQFALSSSNGRLARRTIRKLITSYRRAYIGLLDLVITEHGQAPASARLDQFRFLQADHMTELAWKQPSGPIGKLFESAVLPLNVLMELADHLGGQSVAAPSARARDAVRLLVSFSIEIRTMSRGLHVAA
ncbi:MAG: hypothetical protein EKK53_11170 [Burkholderiales bacterium]|nr:MAG: hypothetical protein EKK53_11170 [Burkholderiales bacterium]